MRKSKKSLPRNIVKTGDKLMKGGKPTDAVVVVMGPNGAGKSTFINTLVGQEVTEVGIVYIKHNHPLYPESDRRLIIVDTPGFDDTYLDDAEILRRISAWLASSYQCDMKLAGMIYMQSLSDSCLVGIDKYTEIFHKLCGDAALSSVALVTSQWSLVSPEDIGKKRETFLKESLWRDIIVRGGEVFKFEDTSESAWKIVNHLLVNHDRQTASSYMRIQEEIVDLRKMLPLTDAGQALRYSLEQLMRRQRDLADRNPDSSATANEMKKTLKAIKGLKMSLPSTIWHQARSILDFFARSSEVSGSQQDSNARTKRANNQGPSNTSPASNTGGTPGIFYRAQGFAIGGAAMVEGAGRVTVNQYYYGREASIDLR